MPDPIRWGLDNPHPLSQMKTELVWAGKYDATGRRVAPVRIKLPFQAVETVNESAQERQMAVEVQQGQARVAVKVICIVGNDTTKTLRVEVGS